jgi:ferrous iron transport protein B
MTPPDWPIGQSPIDADVFAQDMAASTRDADVLLTRAQELRRTLSGNFRDELVEAIYADAHVIADRAVQRAGLRGLDWDQRIDRALTSPLFGLPLMLLVLAIVFWLTIAGSNVPSQMLMTSLLWVEGAGSGLFESLGAPWWLTGFVWHGVYRALAWVIAVMLPPMAIFFPMFTMLEDLGYLPRVAFNLDRLFAKAGAHGKQVLTMSMGFGCNAAGVISCRTIDSPRERLIAILTNNFVPCNGRWPTLILLATVFIAAAFPPAMASAAAAGSVVMVAVIGVLFTLIVSAILSRTVLKGEASAFTLELPPYRRPSILRTLYTSLIDRTIFVLWRAIVFAAPAGGVIWLLANITIGGESLAQYAIGWLDPLGHAIGLDGVILLAYVIAIPANEIVVPTILMLYLGNSMMTEEFSSSDNWRNLFIGEHDWTLLTAVNLMLFSLLHNPCSTTIYTTWKETRSLRWTTLGALMPLAIGFAVTFVVAQVWRLFVP